MNARQYPRAYHEEDFGYMSHNQKINGSVLLITIFVTALLAAITIGILQVNTEEIQLMRNQIYAAEAQAIAETGLNDAFSELRVDSSWNSGFSNKVFDNGSYSVTVSGTLPNLIATSTGTSAQGFVARVGADITVGSISPYIIRIDSLRINE
jgi:Tfp pilus assembly protein PilX